MSEEEKTHVILTETKLDHISISLCRSGGQVCLTNLNGISYTITLPDKVVSGKLFEGILWMLTRLKIV